MDNVVDKEILDLLRTIPTPYISDVYTQLGIRGLKAQGILPVSPFDDPYLHMAGPAVTMRFLPSRGKYGYQKSPLRHTEIIEDAPIGSVIVSEGASVSQRASQTALRSGLEAAVCTTPIRDIDQVQRLKFPVFCPGGPLGAKMETYAETMECVGHNIPVYCGLTSCSVLMQPGNTGAQVCPGDIVVGDNNGVIIIPQDLLSEVVEAVKEIRRLEGEIDRMVDSGSSWKEIYATVHAQKYSVKPYRF